MKVVDANVLLYAVNSDAPHHERARSWLDAALKGGEAVGFAWVVLLAFLRLATRQGVFPRPLTLERAVSVVDAWLAQPVAVMLEPTVRHLDVLHRLLAPLSTAGNLVTDGHLAAVAMEYRGEVVSFDTEYGRFTGLRWRLPG
jgi:toxin-antitoxin system PIN domain toxin